MRRHFANISARKLSLELDVAVNSWASWESGNNLPSAHALMALAARGIDVHWLLTGEGQMLRSQRPDEGLGFVTQLFDQVRPAHWKDRMEILGRLVSEYPDPLSVQALASQLKLKEEQVLVSLLLLVSLGKVVVRKQNGGLFYGAISSTPGQVEQEPDDRAEMMVDILRFIGTEVLPASEAAPPRGLLWDGRISVTDASEFMRRVLAAIKDEADALHSSDGVTLRLILAASRR